MKQSDQLLSYLKEHGRISLLGSIKSLGIVNPSAVVSEIRRKHGKSVILTTHIQVMNNSGTRMVNLPEYELTEYGRAVIFKKKQPFPAWITKYENICP